MIQVDLTNEEAAALVDELAALYEAASIDGKKRLNVLNRLSTTLILHLGEAGIVRPVLVTAKTDWWRCEEVVR